MHIGTIMGDDPYTQLPLTPGVRGGLQGGDDDIDALLARMQMADAAQREVQVEADCSAPSARVFASFTATTSQASRCLRNACAADAALCTLCFATPS